jgi:hypothetical protein
MERTLPALTVVCATLALLAAGCGGQKSFSLAETRACLAGQPHVSLARNVDFVASTALGGAVLVDLGRNDVTIAFGLNRDEADRIANAYRRFRGRNIGIEDVLRPERNAVLLWRAHPSPENESTVTSCLK